MKRTIFLVLIMILSVGAYTVWASNDEPLAPETTALSETFDEVDADEEIALLKARVEEIRDMDKSELTREEKRELRKELRDTQKELQARGVYIGAGTLILLIILILLLR